MTRFIEETSLGALVVMAAVLCCAPPVLSAQSAFHDQPASVRSLPADNLPPFAMLDEAGHFVPAPQLAKGALHGGPGSPPESTARGPGLELSMAAAHAAVKTCSAAGYRVGAAVIDTIGEARAMLTADGSDGSHVFVAMRKALAALEFRVPSSEAYAKVMQDKTLIARVKPNMFVEGGAVPIFSHGELIGAIGVSGAGGTVIGQQDEACASAALKQIRARLP
jgi:uncharacterized protein GlcG (DUF336 family)